MDSTKYYYQGKVRHYCKDCGTLVRESYNERIDSIGRSVFVDEQGFAQVSDVLCSNCAAKRGKKMFKRLKHILIFLIIVGIIGGALLLFKNVVFGSSRLYQWSMEKKIEKYEDNDNLFTDASVGREAGTYVIESLNRTLAESDYKLRYYADEMAEVQKYTLGDKVIMSWDFNDGFGELSNKTYVLKEGVLYEDGDEKIAYKDTSAKYSELVNKLYAYLPENCCGKGKYTSESWLDIAEEKFIAYIVYGEDATILYNYTDDSYDEKAGDNFIHIEITAPGEDSAPKLPDSNDYQFAE